MGTSEEKSIVFYQNLGQLFYAISAADKTIRVDEIQALKQIIKKEWLAANGGAAFQIEKAFDTLVEKRPDANRAFNAFTVFKRSHEPLFTDVVKLRVLTTARFIASAFAGINKSELIMLAKLDLEFKKT